MRLSVVIPVGPHEDSWRTLARQLPENCEAVWAIGARSKDEFRLQLSRGNDPSADLVINSEVGRAAQQNAGAQACSGDYILFMHADSQILPETRRVLQSLGKFRLDGIGYFDLKFTDGSVLMRFTELGVYLRCLFLKLPFGDQGLVLSKQLFLELGGFPLLAVGADLVFVRQARLKGIVVKRLGAKLGTSARKYHHQWLKTTSKHLYLTYKLMRVAKLSSR